MLVEGCITCQGINYNITNDLISHSYLFDRVQETLPLYDILNEFQKGHSHMAIVVRRCNTAEQLDGNTADSKFLF